MRVMPPAVAVLLVLAVVGWAGAPARAMSLVTPDGLPVGGTMQRWVDQSQVALPNVTVVVRSDDPAGLTNRAAGARVDGYLSGDREVAVPGGHPSRQILMHELGHMFDRCCLTPTVRDAIRRDILHTPIAWVTDWASRTDVAAGAEEQFAEMFSAVARHGRIHAPYVGPNYPSRPVTPQALEQLRFAVAVLARSPRATS